MYRFVLLSFVLVSIQALSPDDMQKCKRFMEPGGMSCCKKKYQMFDVKGKEECLKLPMKPPSCEAQICFAKKDGFGSDDGSFDKAAFTKVLEKKLENDQTFMNMIKEKCLNSDINKYASADFCELEKFRACVEISAMKDCPEWDTKDQCSDAEEAAKECVKMFA